MTSAQYLTDHLTVYEDTVAVIARLEQTSNEVILFLPYDWVNYGNIACWTPSEGHNEASLEYYHETHPVYARQEEADLCVKRYKALLRSLPEPCGLRVLQRLPHDWREHAWRI